MAKSRRAAPLPPDERREMILEGVIPLLVERGPAVTSKEIAEHLGLSEGTVFRAFGDKETLVRAAVVRYFDPEPLRDELRSIDPAATVEDKLTVIVRLLRDRFRGIFRLAALLSERPMAAPQTQDFASIIGDLLEPDADRLNVPPERVAHIARMLAFSASFPRLNEGIEPSDEELVSTLLYGVVGVPAPGPERKGN